MKHLTVVKWNEWNKAFVFQSLDGRKFTIFPYYLLPNVVSFFKIRKIVKIYFVLMVNGRKHLNAKSPVHWSNNTLLFKDLVGPFILNNIILKNYFESIGRKADLVTAVLNRPQPAKMAEYLASIFGTEKDK